VPGGAVGVPGDGPTTQRRGHRREASHLEDAVTSVSEITAWITDADETPLSELGFDAVQTRHETLAEYRNRCEDVARQRQVFLRERTSRTVDFDIHHRRLVTYLYEDAPAGHPVLATAARLDAVCRDCQRAVRSHLVRRGRSPTGRLRTDRDRLAVGRETVE
jgi:hypothetical protein